MKRDYSQPAPGDDIALSFLPGAVLRRGPGVSPRLAADLAKSLTTAWQGLDLDERIAAVRSWRRFGLASSSPPVALLLLDAPADAKVYNPGGSMVFSQRRLAGLTPAELRTEAVKALRRVALAREVGDADATVKRLERSHSPRPAASGSVPGNRVPPPPPTLTGLTGVLTNPTEPLMFPPGDYYYVVTSLTSDGESLPSNELHVNIAGGNIYGVYVQWNTVPGALGYKIYRGPTAGGENVWIAVPLGGNSIGYTNTYVDPNVNGAPPSADTTAGPLAGLPDEGYALS